MPVFIDDDPAEELAILRDWERRTHNAAVTSRRWTAVQAATLHTWAARAPWVEPQAMMAFAQTGITPDSTLGRQVVTAAAQDYYQGWQQGQEPDNLPTRVQSRVARARQALQVARTQTPTTAEQQLAWLRPENAPDDSGDDGGGGGIFDRLARGAGRVAGAVESGLTSARDFVTPDSIFGDDEAQRAALERSTEQVVNPIARTAFMAANAPLQELQGRFRETVSGIRERGFLGNLGNTTIQPAQSDALIALEQLVQGQPVDVGTGLYVDPTSGVAQERYRRELQYGTADGHVITPGRWFVDSILGMDPGDTGYSVLSGTVDAGVAMGLDPTDWIGGAIIRGARASRAITATGRLDDLTETVRPSFLDPAGDVLRQEEVGLLPNAYVPDVDRNTAASWLTSGPGAQIVEHMAATSDFYELWRATSGRIRPDILVRIADESDPDMVRRILFEEATLNLGDNFTYALPDTTRGTWTRRAFADMPVDRLRLDDGVEFLNGLDAMLINARIPAEQISPLMREAAEARNRLDRINVFERGLGVINRNLVEEFDLPEDVARELTTWMSDEHRMQDVLFNLRTATDGDVQTIIIDGQASYMRRAQLDVEMAPDVVSIPNVREIRRLTGALKRIRPLLADETGKLRLGWRFFEGLNANVWKRLTLLRVAWPIRQVLIDEQLRLAAVGMPNVYSHPIQLLAAALDSRFDDLADVGPNGPLNAAAELSDTLLRDIPYESAWRPSLDMWAPLEKTEATIGSGRFVEAWGRELGQLHASRVGRKLAETRSVDAVVRELLDGDLSDLAESLARMPSNPIVGEPGLRAWVQSIEDRLLVKTGGNDELIAAVRDGYLTGSTGQPLYFWHGNGPTDGFHGRLAAYVDAAPPAVKEQIVQGRNIPVDLWDRATTRAFSWLGAKPSNVLSRSPAWRHNYFETLIDKFPLLDEAAQERALALARRYRTAAGLKINVLGREFGVGGDLLARMEEAAGRGVTGNVAWGDVDQFARIEAMRLTQELLGDLTTKNHLADAVRVFSPFAAAWREMVGAYIKIVQQNPLVLYKGAKAVQGPVESGFFYRDQNGEWVFNYPLSAEFMSWVPFGPDTPIPLTGRAQGLTMGFEVLPGFGPMAQLPASWVLPNTPRWDGVREIIMPYGVESDPRHFLSPEWLEKVSIFLTNQDGQHAGWARWIGQALGGDNPVSAGQYAYSVGDVATYLATTGEYDLSTEAGVAQLIDDARARAANLWLWRGLSQFAAPSAPRPNPVMEDPDGELVVIAAASERLWELREEDPQNAGRRFLDEFGDLAFMLLEPKTESNALYNPGDAAGYDWVRTHAETLADWPIVGTLFAPTGGGDVGYAAYAREIELGVRRARDPLERFMSGQDQLASILYNRAREQALTIARQHGRQTVTPEAQAILREYRQVLMDRYPGYLRGGRTLREIEQTIGQLEDAMATEALFRDSEAGQALTEYLRYRDVALAQLRANGVNTLQANAAAGVRAVLTAAGERLVADHPSFINMWDRLLSRELEDPDE